MTRLLIVEDDVEQARGMARVFSKLRPDLTVITAHNGLEATRLLREGRVDLVLTDLQMPEMDGFALVAWMNNALPEVPVFTMSGYEHESAARSLRGLGAIECFSKPLDARSVLGRLSETINQSVRGHVQNVSLASFLQLLEMERKTCTLTIASDDKTGVLIVEKGALVGARTGARGGQDAAIAIIAWPFPSITISRHIDQGEAGNIEASLGFILMEAMRVQDEDARNGVAGGVTESVLPAPRRTWRPSSAASQWPLISESASPFNGESDLPSGARALAVVETASGRLLHSTARAGFPLGELALMASQILLQENAMLKLCTESEGVEELVLSTSSRCDVIRPLGAGVFALLIFAPEETNLVMARIELEHFIASRAQRTP